MFGFAEPPATIGVPSPKFQENEYGVVPPEAEAVKLTEVPTVPVVGAVVKTTANVSGEIVIVADAVASFAFASVTFTFTVYVPLTA